jgi:hypothetical protein
MSANRCITIRDVATAANAERGQLPAELLQSKPTLGVQETCILSNGNARDRVYKASASFCTIISVIFHVTYRKQGNTTSSDELVNNEFLRVRKKGA